MTAIALLAASVLASSEENTEYLASYNPAKGFKPAQRDLTEIYLQLAGSLEAHGSPEPYLRHVAAEHTRIEALYKKQKGKELKSFRPEYLTDAYIDRLAANWKLLSPKIGLEAYAKEFGHGMRNAIKGTRDTGTIIIDIFNQHQRRVFDVMAGKRKDPIGFEDLRLDLVRELELDKTFVDEERYEMARRDAVSFALGIHGITIKLFKRLDAGLAPEASEKVKSYITSVILDTGMMAQSELEVATAEWGFSKTSTTTARQ